MMNPFGEHVRALLTATGLRHKALADAIGINPPELSDWINPAKPNRRITLASALKVAAGLKANLNTLVPELSPAYDAVLVAHRRRLAEELTRVAPSLRLDLDPEIAWFCGDAAITLSSPSSLVSPSSSSALAPPLASSTTSAVRSEGQTVDYVHPTARLLLSLVRSLSLDSLILLQSLLASEVQTRADNAPEERPASGG